MQYIRNKYISCGSSIRPNCVAWGKDNVMCFGNGKSLVIAEISETPVIHQTLVSHTDDIVHVSFLDNLTGDSSNDNRILSTSADCSFKVWQPQHRGEGGASGGEGGASGLCSPVKYKMAVENTDHEMSVTRGHGVIVNGSDGVRTLIATSSSDNSIHVSDTSDKQIQINTFERVQLKRGHILSLKWMCKAPLRPVLITGDDRGTVEFYRFAENEEHQLQKNLSLPVHSDWIRDIDIQLLECGDFMVATCSQDCTIKIHKLIMNDAKQLHQQVNTKEDVIKRPTTRLTLENNTSFSVILESVLLGHENWIYSIQWRPNVNKDDDICLLSTSMDKSIILWSLEKESNLWIEQVRLGDVGGNSLGYIGGRWSDDGSQICSQAFDGCLQLWTLEGQTQQWRPSTTFGGHIQAAKDLCWQPITGHFLLTAGQDQTVRLHAQWNTDKDQTRWAELARPQIHGYNMQCVTMIDRFTIVSAGEEKIIRVFGATTNFIDNFQHLTRKFLMSDQDKASLPGGASIAALGLSNKAQQCGDGDSNNVAGASVAATTTSVSESGAGEGGGSTSSYVEQSFNALRLSEPPTTSDLSQNTLWPEKQKLYSHGYDVYTLASHPQGHTLVSACKATKEKHAEVVLWNAEDWQPRQRLPGHSLTVTSAQFSRGQGRHLLTVSRDRTWNLYRQSDGDKTYELQIKTDKNTSGHSRIIWACSWSHDNAFFCTVSRDKKAIVWKTPSTKETSNLPASFVLSWKYSITAVDFAPEPFQDGSYLLALGFEDGFISLFSFSENHDFTCICTMDKSMAHQETVTKLAFRPCVDLKNDLSLTLASCSADSTVKIYEIDIQLMNQIKLGKSS